VRVTPIYAAICAALMIALAARVVRMRGKYGVGIGAGTEPVMERAIRVHANFAENVPMALLLLALAELQGASAIVLYALGAALVVSRVFHAQGLSAFPGRSFGRFVGTALCWTAMLVNAGICAYRALV
jgi:uncharacterized membrane protein YecN with MAPEG domain